MRAANPSVASPRSRPGGAADGGWRVASRAWAIREATTADAGAIAVCIGALAEELVAAKGEGPLGLEHGPTAQRIACHLRSASYRAYLAWRGGAVIGVITLTTDATRPARGCYAWIEECFVAPEWRGRGVGTALVDAARVAARADCCNRLEVTCPSSSAFAATRRFYEREGFHVAGARTLALAL